MRRFLAIFCTLVVLCCGLTLAVYAADGVYTHTEVLERDLEDLSIASGSLLDLNGYSVEILTVVGDEPVLYCIDSATDDYSVADGVYGKIAEVAEGTVLPGDGYLQVTEADGISFHRVSLEISAMTLRPDVAGVYYTSDFAGDEVVAANVESYGVALSLMSKPTPGNTDCGYSIFNDFQAGEGANAAASGTLLKNVLKTTNLDAINARNANVAIYGRAYLKTAEGYVFGDTVSRSLKTQVEAVNEELETLDVTKKDAAYAMYETYASLMADWDVSNIVAWPEVKAEPVVKFVTKFVNDYLYRVGNANAVTLGSLFEAAEVVDDKVINVSGVTVTAEPLNETSSVSGAVTANTSDWTKTAIQFSGTGLAKITIQDDDRCIPTELIVEVVDAVNATGATNATANNVVLLNNCGFSSLTVSGGYTLYGNGFTMTCGSDSAALDMGYAFVTLTNGTLDNVQIITPNFDYAVLYKSNMTDSGNRSQTTDKTRYYNVKSGVMASGNSQILNSRISGGRAAVNVSGGNVLIDNSRIELGAVASVLVGAANHLTLRDVTLVQKPTASTYDSSKTLMGFSVLFVCDANGDAAPVTLEGTLVQNAWVDENDKQYVPSAGQSLISTVLKKTEYLHNLDGDGTNESLNLGFAYLPESATSKVNATTITDNRTNQAAIPYDYAEVSTGFSTTYVYAYKNTNGTDASFKTETAYAPTEQGDNITVTYSDTSDGLETGKSFATSGWVYELNVDLDKLPGYALDFGKLSMSVNGITVTDYKVDGNTKPASAAVVAGGVTYTLTATVDGKEYTANFKVTGTETSKESPTLVAANYEAGLCVASSYGGTWHGAAPALQGIQIKYWSVAEKQYKTITLSDYTPATAGKQNGTDKTWTYSPANGDFTLTLTGGQVHSSNNVYAMPVVCNGKLYFVAANSNGLVNSGNSARSVPVSYTFKDNNNGDVLTFSHTWSVAENKDEQYKYSDFCNGTLTQLTSGSSGSCVTPDTLITLADGTQKRVDQLTGDELLLVWNLETGKYDTAPIVFVDSDQQSEYEIIHLYFSDGSDVKVISEHGFFDLNLAKYVYIDAENYADYVGHSFVKQGDISANTWTAVVLEKVVLEKEITTAWSPVTFAHLNYYTNGALSMPGGIAGLFNIFDVDTAVMAYDADKKAADIAAYGLLTLEDFGGMITEDAFYAFNGAYLNVAIGKGLLTWEDIAYMAERYIPLM
ncbi:MAG: hypothetical protein IKJ94_01375 [Oscillospiraceae bacterium]|nr:hypothetical protein [Oscillospiraceae bacterium]